MTKNGIFKGQYKQWNHTFGSYKPSPENPDNFFIAACKLFLKIINKYYKINIQISIFPDINVFVCKDLPDFTVFQSAAIFISHQRDEEATCLTVLV